MNRFFLFALLMLGASCSTKVKKDPNIATLIERKAGIRLDKQETRMIEKRSPPTLEKIAQALPLTLEDIIVLSELGISDRFLIEYRKESQASYNLRYVDILRLQEAGVSQQVIHDLVNTGR